MFNDGPVLDTVAINTANVDTSQYPFIVPVISNLKSFKFKSQVTFFVGENGSGKSTLLEALAERIGFGKGGSKNLSMLFDKEDSRSDVQKLSGCMSLSWRKKTDGYFFRAESFWDIANKLEILEKEPGGSGTFLSYGGKNLHHMSHGEAFLSFFKNRIGRGGIYILDEPEAALSPQRQLSLMIIIHELCKDPDTQFIVATHSPILLAYPKASIYSCDGDRLKEIAYEDTAHYQITKDFMHNPNRYLQRLF